MNNSFYLMEGVVLSLECIVLVDRPLWIGLFISESVSGLGQAAHPFRSILQSRTKCLQSVSSLVHFGL